MIDPEGRPGEAGKTLDQGVDLPAILLDDGGPEFEDQDVLARLRRKRALRAGKNGRLAALRVDLCQQGRQGAIAEMGVERIVYTDIARDGMLSGINIEATRAIAEASGLHVTASGGVATLDDIYAVKELEEYGVDSVIVGKALYEGVFTLEEALDAAEE